ncbi:MAG: MFS transporter [Limisphaerales bacterium]
MNLPRKRDLLLSLKYCTIESCFSVPMLNLTLTQFPFILGFAVTGLGWRSGAIGWLAAIHHICNALQPPIYWALRRRLSLHRIIVLGFWFNALPWLILALLPFLGPHRDWVFGSVVFAATLANSVASVAWSAATGELVPIHIRGKFFGRRNMIFGFWTLVVVLAAGTAAEYYHSSLAVFGAIFAAAGLMRLVGLYFLLRMRFPPQVMEPHQQPERFGDYLAVFQSRDYLWLVAFVGFWGLALNIGMPFYSVYVLRELPLTIRDLTVFTTLATLGGLLALPTWGLLSDRFGSKPVMLACAFLWVASALPSWLFAGPAHHVHLYVTYFVVGAVTAGFQLCQFNLMVKMIPARSKAPYISVFLATTSLLTALGPLIGAQLLMNIPNSLGEFLGQPILRFHVVFAGSLVLCLFATHLLQSMREPEERPLSELVRVMRTMREFNPVLGVAAVAELVFTPRRITRFAADSMRNLRKQTADIAEVGEELATAGLSVFRPRRKPRPTSAQSTEPPSPPTPPDP